MVDENIDVPAAILLKDAVASIPYTIASKNLAEIIKGTLMMEAQQLVILRKGDNYEQFYL